MIRRFTFSLSLFLLLIPIATARAQTSGDVFSNGTVFFNGSTSGIEGGQTVDQSVLDLFNLGDGNATGMVTSLMGFTPFNVGDSATTSVVLGTETFVAGEAEGDGLASTLFSFFNGGPLDGMVDLGFAFDLGASNLSTLPLSATIGDASQSLTLSDSISLSDSILFETDVATNLVAGDNQSSSGTDDFSLLVPSGQSVFLRHTSDGFLSSLQVPGSTGEPTVPEPSATVILVLGSISFVLRRRKSL